MSTFVIAVLSVIFSVAAQFLLKAGMSDELVKSALAEPMGINTAITVFSNINILGGFALYGLGAIVWLGVLSQWDVSKAYPLVGLGFVFTVLVGWFLGEHVTFMRFLGVMFIVLGVLLIGKS